MLAHLNMPNQIDKVPACAPEHATQLQPAKSKEVASRSFAAKKARTQKPSWNVVWCHEHCHKGKMHEMSLAMQGAAKEIRAAMVSLKKADRYMKWLETQHSRPHVLITNWREVKPTVQGMADASSCAPPLCIVVLAESAIVLHRASEWAKSFSHVRIEVLLETALEPLKALLASYSEDAQFPQAPPQVAQLLPETCPALCAPLVTSPPVKKHLAKNGLKQMRSKDTLPLSIVKPPCMDMLTDPEAKEDIVPAFARPVAPQHHAGSLLAFLTEAVKHQHTAGRIQQDLLMNMPEVYED